MIKLGKLYLTGLCLAILSCNVATWQSIIDDSQLTEAEVVDGLKTALRIGAEMAVQTTSKKDGYFGDETIKILLPDEAENVISTLKKAPGGEKLYDITLAPIVDDLVQALNRSAENAAEQAAPIFKNAITQMTVQEAWAILNGEYKNAGNKSATIYFKDKTQRDLTRLFQPVINNSLDKPLVNSLSANSIWDKFMKSYQSIENSPANLLMNLKPIEEPDLSLYVTSKALDGLFIKVAEQEQEIRKDPYKYANQILEKVFGRAKN